MTKYTGATACAVGMAVLGLLAAAQATAAAASDTSVVSEATARPAFSPAPGGYSTAQTITITDVSPNTTIYYTTNGQTPTTASKKYVKPLKLTSTTTYKAIAVAANGQASAVTTASYLIDLGAVPVPGGNVYSAGHLAPGISFAPFGGSTNNPLPAPDPSTLFADGTPALKLTVCGAGCGYSGGAFVAKAPAKLTGANALVFWAKASQNQNTLKVQLGNDSGTGANVNYQVESIGIPLTTNWQEYFIPLPDPSKATGFDGLISFADGPNNYTFWLADVEYAVVSAPDLGKASQVFAGWSNLAIPPGPGGAVALNPGPNSIIWTGAVPTLPNGQNLDNVSWRWYDLTSDNPSIATVSADGVVTGVAPGVAHITAKMAGISVPGQAVVTVTQPLTSPTNYAPTPTASPVTALFDSSGVYPTHVDTLATSWSSAVVTNPFPIAGGNGVIEYQLNNFAGIAFGDGEFNNNSTANTVNAAAAGYTKLHASVWTPNPTDLQFQLVNNASCNDAAGCYSNTGFQVGIYDAGVLAANQWVDLDLPLSSFTGGQGLTSTDALQQLLLISGAGNGLIVYVDNLYFH